MSQSRPLLPLLLAQLFIAQLFMAQLGWQGVAAAQTIVMATEDDWFPFTALIDGQARGLSVDVISEAYALEGVSVEFQPHPYIRCMDLALHADVVGCFNTAPMRCCAQNTCTEKNPFFMRRLPFMPMPAARNRG